MINVNSLIGKEIGKDTIKSIVTSLDMKIEAENENQIEILVPAYRVDVKRPCDVVKIYFVSMVTTMSKFLCN